MNSIHITAILIVINLVILGINTYKENIHDQVMSIGGILAIGFISIIYQLGAIQRK